MYFNHHFALRDEGWIAFSRGFEANNPNNIGPISEYARVKLQQLGIPIPDSLPFPCRLTEMDLIAAQTIIVMNEPEHRPFMQKLFPQWEDKVVFWNIYDVQDEAAETSLVRLEERIDGLLNGFLF